MAPHDCMISIHDHAVQRCMLGGIPVQTGHDRPESMACCVLTADGCLADRWGIGSLRPVDGPRPDTAPMIRQINVPLA